MVELHLSFSAPWHHWFLCVLPLRGISLDCFFICAQFEPKGKFWPHQNLPFCLRFSSVNRERLGIPRQQNAFYLGSGKRTNPLIKYCSFLVLNTWSEDAAAGGCPHPAASRPSRTRLKITTKRAAKRAPSEPSDSEANGAREIREPPKRRCLLTT